MTSLAAATATNAATTTTALPMTDVLLSQLSSLRQTLMGMISVYGSDISCYNAIQTCVAAFVSRLAVQYHLQPGMWRLKLVVLTLQFLRRDNTLSQVVAVRLMDYFQAQQQPVMPQPPTTASSQSRQWQFQQNQQKLKQLQQQQHQQQLTLLRTQQQKQQQELLVKQQQQKQILEERHRMRRESLGLGVTTIPVATTVATRVSPTSGAAVAATNGSINNTGTMEASKLKPSFHAKDAVVVDLTIGDDDMASKKKRSRQDEDATSSGKKKQRRQVLGDLTKANAEDKASASSSPEAKAVRSSRRRSSRGVSKTETKTTTSETPTTKPTEPKKADVPPPSLQDKQPSSTAMSIIPTLLSNQLSQANKYAVLQAYDVYRNSQEAIQKSQQQLDQARRDLQEAEQRHDQQLAAGVKARAALQGLMQANNKGV